MRTTTLLVLALALLASCADAEAELTTEAEPTTTQLASTTTTTEPTTTTTELATTTTGFLDFLSEPSQEDLESYAVLGLVMLNKTAFGPEAIGNEQFLEMILGGAQLACLNLNEGGSLVEAVEGAIGRSPVRFKMPEDWTSEETTAAFSTAIHVITNGLKLYCPTLAPRLSSDSESAAEELTNAWLAFLGEEPLDTSGWIRDGIWAVGVDIQPGTYRNSGNDGCYWERLSGFSGESGDLIANGYPDGDPAIVDILPTDAGFLSEDCDRWVPIDE